MKVEELYQFLAGELPRELSASWDNDGIACLPLAGKQVNRVLIALDATAATVKRAVEQKFDVLLTHHPLLFRGVKEITPAYTVPRKLLQLIRADVAAISFHTRLDAVAGGVNDILAQLLGLCDVTCFGPEGEELGRIGTLPVATDAKEYAQTVCEKLHIPFVLQAGEGQIRRVAVLGGEGGDFVDAAIAAGADLFLAGRIGYHRMLDGAEEGIVLMEAGHFATEVAVCHRLSALVHKADPTITVEIDTTPAIQAVAHCKGESEK